MSSPRPYEDNLEMSVSRLLDRSHLASNHNRRLEILEAAAAQLGGWSLDQFRDRFPVEYELSTQEVRTVAQSIISAIQKVGVPPSLVLCRLAQPPLSTAEQRKTGAYYTDFRLAAYLARQVAPQLPRGGRVIDTASGTGVLLVALALEVCGSDQAAMDAMLAEQIFAADLSDAALRGARLALGSLTGSIEVIEKLDAHLLSQDSLMEAHASWSKISPNGFDAVIGNPPWEKLKLSRHEHSRELGVERHYGSDHNDDSTIEKSLHERRSSLAGYVTELSSRYPSAANGEFDLYKAFLALATRLVSREGQIALLVPAGLIRSAGTESLRRTLLDEAGALSITVFENRARFFAIDTRFKFLAVHATFGAAISSTMELRHGTGSGDGIEVTGRAALDRTDLERCRRDLTVPEVRSTDEWMLFKKLVEAGRPLDDPIAGWAPTPMREVDMTRDRKRFVRADSEDNFPVVEGRMVHQHRVGVKSYISGTGRSAVWLPNNAGNSAISPQFWIPRVAVPSSALKRTQTARVGFCDVTGQTNERTILAAMIPSDVVCGNKVPTLLFEPGSGPEAPWAWLAIANSFVFDWMARRVVTTTINYFLLMGLPMPPIRPDSLPARRLADLAKRLHHLDHCSSASATVIAGVRADIDAHVAIAYGLELPELALVFEDFPLIDRGQPHLPGESRSTITRDMVLARTAELYGGDGAEYASRVQRAARIGGIAYIPAQYDAVEAVEAKAT